MEVIVVSLLFGVLLLFVTILFIVEPVFIWFYKRPLFLHWHPYPFLFKPSSTLSGKLEKEFIFYSSLPVKQKRYFERRVTRFINYYSFIGKNVEVSYEMKVLVAGTYVMLTFGMRNYLTTYFNKIILYPTVYYSTINNAYHKGEFNPKLKIIVFSWEDFLSGHKVKNNVNLGLHEFTHALLFHSIKKRDTSAIIFHEEFEYIAKYFDNEDFLNALKVKAYFRDYAYTNKFEFLSVILEHFFETPHIFKAKFPELFERVKRMVNYKEV